MQVRYLGHYITTIKIILQYWTHLVRIHILNLYIQSLVKSTHLLPSIHIKLPSN
jgi:hypothetical protein